MKFQFLGTAAAEAVPALFCQCPACEHARAAGGKEIRLRAGAVINDRLMLDFPQDVYHSVLRHNIRLCDITDILFTHSHSDHCADSELIYRSEPTFCTRNDHTPLRLHGNAAVRARLERHDEAALIFSCTEYHELALFEPTEIAGLTVTALPAEHKHDETAHIYLIEDGAVRILYGHDTGYFYDSVFDYLRGKRLDMISLDCCGATIQLWKGHMGMEANAQIRERLIEIGAVDAKTRCIANHFSHNGLHVGDEVYDHEKLAAYGQTFGMEVSFDGMVVTL